MSDILFLGENSDTMKYAIMTILLLVPLCGLSAPFELGVSGGYSLLGGRYADELNNGPHAGLAAVPVYFGRLHPLLRLDYSQYVQRENSASVLRVWSGRAHAAVDLFSGAAFSPYVAAGGGAEYVTLSGDGEAVRSFKPVASAETGFRYLFDSGVSLRLFAGYRFKQLSDISFHSLDAGALVSYRFGETSPATEGIRDDTAERLVEGIALFDARRTADAAEVFRSIRRNSPEAQRYLDRIADFDRQYAEAVLLEQGRRETDALVVYDRLSRSMLAAETAAARVRGSLASQRESLAREGVAAYERGEYRKAVDLLYRLSIIAPGDRTAQMYLPRARRKAEAIEKLGGEKP
jgi:opacity protein-like surface antigen